MNEKKEPNGLMRIDGKRSDGWTFIPEKASKPLSWDVTVTSALAALFDSTALSTSVAAGMTALRKSAKYAYCKQSHIFSILHSGPYPR